VRVLPQDIDPTAIPAGLPNATELRPAGATGGTGPVAVVPASSGGGGTGPSQIRFIDTNAVRILHQVNPVYPALARMTHVQGPVVLMMTIDQAGVPTDVQVLEGHPVFREEAVRAARQWRFEPARVEGRPVPASFRLTLNFRLM
jgi:protein TonB